MSIKKLLNFKEAQTKWKIVLLLVILVLLAVGGLLIYYYHLQSGKGFISVPSPEKKEQRFLNTIRKINSPSKTELLPEKPLKKLP